MFRHVVNYFSEMLVKQVWCHLLLSESSSRNWRLWVAKNHYVLCCQLELRKRIILKPTHIKGLLRHAKIKAYLFASCTIKMETKSDFLLWFSNNFVDFLLFLKLQKYQLCVHSNFEQTRFIDRIMHWLIWSYGVHGPKLLQSVYSIVTRK